MDSKKYISQTRRERERENEFWLNTNKSHTNMFRKDYVKGQAIVLYRVPISSRPKTECRGITNSYLFLRKHHVAVKTRVLLFIETQTCFAVNAKCHNFFRDTFVTWGREGTVKYYLGAIDGLW